MLPLTVANFQDSFYRVGVYLYDDPSHLGDGLSRQAVTKPLVQEKAFFTSELAWEGDEKGIFSVVGPASFGMNELRYESDIRKSVVCSSAHIDRFRACDYIFGDKKLKFYCQLGECS